MTTGARTRGEYAKSADRRQQIVDAAVEVFSSAGYRKGSLRDVADKVGLSQAGLLHHFPSKEHLLEAVLTWRDDVSAELMGDPLPQGVDFLRALVRAAEYNATTPELVEFHVIVSAEGTSADHPVRGYFVDRYTRVLGFTREAFERAAERGPASAGRRLRRRRPHADRADGRAADPVAARPRGGRHGGRPAPLPAAAAHRRALTASGRPGCRRPDPGLSPLGRGKPDRHELAPGQPDPEASLEGPWLAVDRHVPGVDDIDVPPGPGRRRDVPEPRAARSRSRRSGSPRCRPSGRPSRWAAARAPRPAPRR